MAKVRGTQKARQIDVRSATKQQLQMYISQEGKRLNWQLSQLEKRGMVKSSFAYQNLMNRAANLKYLGKSKSGYTKVNLSTRGMTRQQMEGLASVIQKTVNAQTITPSGIKNYYNKVFDSLRNHYPELAQFSDEELGDIFTTEGFEASKTKLDSDRLMQMIAKSTSVDKLKDYIAKSNRFEDVVKAERAYRKLMRSKFEYVASSESPFES